MNIDVFPSKNSFAKLHEHLLVPVVSALKDVEQSGFQVDIKQLEIMESGYIKKLQELENSIRSYPEVLSVEKRLGKKLNFRSGDQISDLFFNELELSVSGISKTKSGKRYSVDKKTVTKLRDEHPIVGLMNEYTKYGTLYKMYIKPARKHISDDNRVHCTYLPLTVTGRLLCMDPNLQQIPKNIKKNDKDITFDFDSNLNIKNMYIPFDDNFDLMEADYSQIELRILGAYSLDPRLIQIFINDLDVHIATGQAMADIVAPGTIVDKDSFWRQAAKCINFGIAYGESDEALAIALSCDVSKAKEFKENYFKLMPGIREYLAYVEEFVREQKYVTTMFGNYRRLPAVTSMQKWIAAEAVRQGGNMPIQGTAGQYTLCAIINLVKMIKKYNMKSRLIGTVHDSILFCRHKTEQQQISEMAQTVMAHPDNKLIYWDMPVPLKAELKVGDRWSNMKDYVLS